MRPVPWNPLPLGRLGPWVWWAAAFAAAVGLGPGLADRLVPPGVKWCDFFQEWSSARNVWEGRPVYAPLAESMEIYLGWTPAPGATRRFQYNAHPPASVLATLPLGLLDYHTALIVWNALSLAALATAFGLILREWRLAIRPQAVPAFTAVAVLCWPLWNQFAHGQWSAVLCLLMTTAWVCYRRGRRNTAAALIAVAASLKLFPALVLLLFLARRQWRPLATAAAVGLAVTAMTVAVLGFDAFLEYGTKVVPSLRAFRADPINVSIPAYLTRCTQPCDAPAGDRSVPPDGDRVYVLDVDPLFRSEAVIDEPWIGAVLIVVAVVGLAGGVVWRAATTGDTDRPFALALVTAVLVSPIAWDHYVLVLLMPLLLIWAFGLPTDRRRLAFLAALVALWTPPLFFVYTLVPCVRDESGMITEIVARPGDVAATLGIPMAGLLVLWCLLWSGPNGRAVALDKAGLVPQV